MKANWELFPLDCFHAATKAHADWGRTRSIYSYCNALDKLTRLSASIKIVGVHLKKKKSSSKFILYMWNLSYNTSEDIMYIEVTD